MEYNEDIMSEQVKNNINTEEAAVAERERKQFVKMTRTPIPRLIISLGIPTMLSMMVLGGSSVLYSNST